MVDQYAPLPKPGTIMIEGYYVCDITSADSISLCAERRRCESFYRQEWVEISGTEYKSIGV